MIAAIIVSGMNQQPAEERYVEFDVDKAEAFLAAEKQHIQKRTRIRRTNAQIKKDLLEQLAALEKRQHRQTLEKAKEIISAIIVLREEAESAKLQTLVAACNQASNAL